MEKQGRYISGPGSVIVRNRKLSDHAKVSEFDPATGRVAQKDVLWLDVSVDEPQRVQVGQSAAELGHHTLTTILLHSHLRTVEGGRQAEGIPSPKESD